MAALLHVTRPPFPSKKEYAAVNIEGTSAVIQAGLQNKVSRIVFFSTISVYGESKGEIFTEASSVNPRTEYAATKLEAEKLVLDAKRSDGRPLGTVLRLAAVYGPRIQGNYRKLLLALVRRKFIPVGNGANRRTLVYDTDVARSAVLAIRHPDAAGKIYNITDGHLHSMREIIRAMSKALNMPPPRLKLPVLPVRYVVGMTENLARMVGARSPINRSTIDKYTEDLAVSGQLARVELGFVPEFDLTRGWREIVLEMRSCGEL